MDSVQKDIESLMEVKKKEGKKLLILTIIIGITILLFIIKYFFFPIFFKDKSNNFIQLINVIKNHIIDVYSNKIDLLLFCLLIALISTLFSFKDAHFKHLGIILVIVYISSIAVEAKLYITGAMLNAVIIYIYLITLVFMDREEKNNKKNL